MSLVMSRRISSFRWGEKGWTVPWALYTNDYGEFRINGRYETSYLEEDERTMRIQKNFSGSFTVDLKRCGEWVRPKDDKPGGVVELNVGVIIT